MSNAIVKINYEEMLNTMGYEEMMELQEKIKERRLNNIDKRVIILEENKIKLMAEVENLNLIIKKSSENINNMKQDFDDLRDKTSKITDTLVSYTMEKRELEKHINGLIYPYVKKGTLRYELFHGRLLTICKGHIKKSLNVSRFDHIMVDDVSTAKKLASKYLTERNIHTLMRKEARRLFEMSQLSKKDNVKNLGTGNGRKFDLLDQLLDEVGGDWYAI